MKIIIATIAMGVLMSDALADRLACPTAMVNFRGELENASEITTTGHVMNAASIEAVASSRT